MCKRAYFADLQRKLYIKQRFNMGCKSVNEKSQKIRRTPAGKTNGSQSFLVLFHLLFYFILNKYIYIYNLEL